MSTNSRDAEYVVLRSPKAQQYPSSPRYSQDSDDSLRALEVPTDPSEEGVRRCALMYCRLKLVVLIEG